MKTAPEATPGPFVFQVGPKLSGAGLKTGYLFLQTKLALLQFANLKRVGSRVSQFLPDSLIQRTVPIPQLTNPGFDGHGLRLHV